MYCFEVFYFNIEPKGETTPLTTFVTINYRDKIRYEQCQDATEQNEDIDHLLLYGQLLASFVQSLFF